MSRPNAEPRPPYATGTCPVCHEPGGFHDADIHAGASAHVPAHLRWAVDEAPRWRVVFLLERCGHRCAYCDAAGVPLTLDHIKPRGRGGSNKVENLIVACEPCNHAKGDGSVFWFSPERAAAIIALAERNAIAWSRWRQAIPAPPVQYPQADAPQGLCGNKDDHAPHPAPASTVGRFWCTADQSTRLPYAAEVRAKRAREAAGRERVALQVAAAQFQSYFDTHREGP